MLQQFLICVGQHLHNQIEPKTLTIFLPEEDWNQQRVKAVSSNPNRTCSTAKIDISNHSHEITKENEIFTQ